MTSEAGVCEKGVGAGLKKTLSVFPDLALKERSLEAKKFWEKKRGVGGGKNQVASHHGKTKGVVFCHTVLSDSPN